MGIRRYRSAGGVVVRQADAAEPQVLLLDRPGRNEVRLPKGHIDAGESPRQAALRETTEETGYADLEILADLGEQVVEFDHEGDHYVRHEFYYLMRLRSDRQVPRSETDANQFTVRWHALATAADQLTYEAERARVRQAMAVLQRLPQQP